MRTFNRAVNLTDETSPPKFKVGDNVLPGAVSSSAAPSACLKDCQISLGLTAGIAIGINLALVICCLWVSRREKQKQKQLKGGEQCETDIQWKIPGGKGKPEH